MSWTPAAGMAKRRDWALPAAYESAMDGLEEQIRQGGHPGPARKTAAGEAGADPSGHRSGAAGSDGGVHGFWNVRVEDVLVGQESSSYRVNGEIPVIPWRAFRMRSRLLWRMFHRKWKSRISI